MLNLKKLLTKIMKSFVKKTVTATTNASGNIKLDETTSNCNGIFGVTCVSYLAIPFRTSGGDYYVTVRNANMAVAANTSITFEYFVVQKGA